MQLEPPRTGVASTHAGSENETAPLMTEAFSDVINLRGD